MAITTDTHTPSTCSEEESFLAEEREAIRSARYDVVEAARRLAQAARHWANVELDRVDDRTAFAIDWLAERLHGALDSTRPLDRSGDRAQN